MNRSHAPRDQFEIGEIPHPDCTIETLRDEADEAVAVGRVDALQYDARRAPA